MATSGTNYTAKWELSNGVLTISPVSGNSGIMRSASDLDKLNQIINLADEEWLEVTKIKFTGAVSFQYNAGLMFEDYIAKKTFTSFFSKATNLVEIDVTGLNLTGATNLSHLFEINSSDSSLATITGLSTLNVSDCLNFGYMFYGSKLSYVDISAFSANAMNSAESIVFMFSQMPYCQTIILPSRFQRTQASDYEFSKYIFGIASVASFSPIQATKDGVTISSDTDFFRLTATSQGGTWTRNVSGVADLEFRVSAIKRDGNTATMPYTYYSNSATVEVYLKPVNQSSFPSTPSSTFTISGSGTGTLTLSLSSDSAYDVMVKAYDSTTTLYTYPSIDSNVLLLSVDQDGNVNASGDIEDGQGNVLADKLDSSGIFDLIYPVGSYYWTSDGNFSPENTFGGTWEKIDPGVTLVSAGTGYTVQSGTAKDGGAETVKLTDQQMAHGHGFTNPTVNNHHHDSLASAGFVNGTGLTMTGKRAYTATNTGGVGYVVSASATAISTSATTADATATTSGGSVANLSGAPSTRTAHNNMPPYKAAYCWHRTA